MPNDQAYAEAMRAVHTQFPDDLDIAMLYVESMMDLRPWGYWMPDGRAHEGTREIVALTEDVLRRNPKHPGALHLLIHLVEPTTTPERAEKAADPLMPLMPAAGHMVHMASHIYQRVGRYADAIKSNQLAIAADEDYITQCRAQGLYPMAYYPHNLHFLWFAATADGQSAVAIDSAQEDRREDSRRGAGRDAAHGRLPGGALLGQRALRPVGRDAEGAGAAGHATCSSPARGTTRAAWRSWPPAASPRPSRSSRRSRRCWPTSRSTRRSSRPTPAAPS